MHSSPKNPSLLFRLLNPSGEKILLRKAALFIKGFAAAISVGASPVGIVQSPNSTRVTISLMLNMSVETRAAFNLYIDYEFPSHVYLGNGDELLLGYGECDISHKDAAHQILGRTYLHGGTHLWPRRFVWMTPDDMPIGACLHACIVRQQDETILIGRVSPGLSSIVQ
jgi:hypothetical protein